VRRKGEELVSAKKKVRIRGAKVRLIRSYRTTGEILEKRFYECDDGQKLNTGWVQVGIRRPGMNLFHLKEDLERNGWKEVSICHQMGMPLAS